MVEIDINYCHKCLLYMAKELHNICQKNNIPYYMVGGSVLGSIRHKGFIPWDDDMDFGVLREHFNDLKTALAKELPQEIRLITYADSELTTDFVKIELVGSKMVIEDGNSVYGISIDIFPLDYTNKHKGLFSRNMLIHLLMKYNVYAFSKDQNESSRLRILTMKLVSAINPFPKTFCLNLIEKITTGMRKNATSITNHFGLYGLKEIQDKETFGEPKLSIFEDTSFYSVADSDTYLKNLYGDYMQLPPENKRHVHCKHIYAERSTLEKI